MTDSRFRPMAHRVEPVLFQCKMREVHCAVGVNIIGNLANIAQVRDVEHRKTVFETSRYKVCIQEIHSENTYTVPFGVESVEINSATNFYKVTRTYRPGRTIAHLAVDHKYVLTIRCQVAKEPCVAEITSRNTNG